MKNTPVSYTSIPHPPKPSTKEKSYANWLYKDLCERYPLDATSPNASRLRSVSEELIRAAGFRHSHWKVHLFSAPQIVDIRAVEGNRIFVWSGILDTVSNDDELAAALAWEMGHSLANHTRPTQFNVWSNIMFQAAEQATAIGLAMVSQGAVNITGASGWMKWAYTEMRDMGPLDRNYSVEQEREAAQIAVLIINRTEYDPHALESFWAKLQTGESSNVSYARIIRGLPPDERLAMLADLLVEVAAAGTVPTVAEDRSHVYTPP